MKTHAHVSQLVMIMHSTLTHHTTESWLVPIDSYTHIHNCQSHHYRKTKTLQAKYHQTTAQPSYPNILKCSQYIHVSNQFIILYLPRNNDRQSRNIPRMILLVEAMLVWPHSLCVNISTIDQFYTPASWIFITWSSLCNTQQVKQWEGLLCKEDCQVGMMNSPG